MIGYRTWFGMSPKPIVKMQYLHPWVKAALGVIGVVFVAFVFFVAGQLWQHEQRTVTISLDLPDNPPLYAFVETDEGPLPYFQPVDYNPDRDILPDPPQSVEWVSTEDEVTCLAQNIYFEARNETMRGKVAVGLTTINRVRDSSFPDTICGVVWQKRRSPTSGKIVAQFSWTWDGKHDRPQEQQAWDEAVRIAGGMVAEGSLDNVVDFTNGSTHYHAEYIDQPYWGRRLVARGYEVQQIDTHLFYYNGYVADTRL